MAAVVGLVTAAAGVLAAATPAAAFAGDTNVFINRFSHLCMDVANGSLDDGARVQQYDCYGGTPEKWRMNPIERIGAVDYFELVNLNSNKCLDIPWNNPAPGIELQQWTCWGGPMQLWSVQTVTTFSGPTTSQVQSLPTDLGGTGLCLDDKDSSFNLSTSLQQWNCWGGDVQLWNLYPTS